jgi:hypothetical protein
MAAKTAAIASRWQLRPKLNFRNGNGMWASRRCGWPWVKGGHRLGFDAASRTRRVGRAAVQQQAEAGCANIRGHYFLNLLGDAALARGDLAEPKRGLRRP